MSCIYYTTPDNKYRYALGEVRETESKILFCFGINPSTATPQKSDSTVKRIQMITSKHGYDSYIILNLCAQRAKNPDNMLNEQNQISHKENLNIITYLLNLYSHNSDILFAYGDLIETRPYLKKNLCEIINIIKTSSYGGNCYCLGKTKSGNARHPLYQKTDTPFVPFSLDGHTYSEMLCLENNKCVIRTCSENGELLLETFGSSK